MKTIRLAALFGLAAFLAACTRTPVATQAYPVTGGRTSPRPLAQGNARPAANARAGADVRMDVVGFVADRERQELVYVFGFRGKRREAPQAVTVEDVSGVKAETLVNGAAPHLAGDGTWKCQASPLRKGNPGLSWLAEPGNTFRVFRLTITTADGRKLILFQAAVWGPALKAAFRQVLGYDVPSAT